jgi:hypothetical protein
VFILNSSGILSWLMKDGGYYLFFVLINLLYFIFGYLYGVNNGKAFNNLLSFSLIALIGIIVWCICLIIYIFSDKSPSFLGPEVLWLLNMGYNFPSIYILKFINVDRLGGFFPVVILVFNLYQSIILWLGLQTRILIKKAKLK